MMSGREKRRRFMESKEKRKIWIRSRKRRFEDSYSEEKKRFVREDLEIRSGSSRVEDSSGGIFVVEEKEKEKEYPRRKGSIREGKKIRRGKEIKERIREEWECFQERRGCSKRSGTGGRGEFMKLKIRVWVRMGFWRFKGRLNLELL
jgi:hypothetical protein